MGICGFQVIDYLSYYILNLNLIILCKPQQEDLWSFQQQISAGKSHSTMSLSQFQLGIWKNLERAFLLLSFLISRSVLGLIAPLNLYFQRQAIKAIGNFNIFKLKRSFFNLTFRLRCHSKDFFALWTPVLGDESDFPNHNEMWSKRAEVAAQSSHISATSLAQIRKDPS